MAGAGESCLLPSRASAAASAGGIACTQCMQAWAPDPPFLICLLCTWCSAEGYGLDEKANECVPCAQEGCAYCDGNIDGSCGYCKQVRPLLPCEADASWLEHLDAVGA